MQLEESALTTHRCLGITLLTMAAMLIAIGVVFSLTVDPAMGGSVNNATDSGSAAINGISGTRVAVDTSLPDDLEEIEVVRGFRAPTNMEFSPDGRLFVLEQRGNIHIVKNGELISTLFLTIEVDNSGDSGLFGLAFDPQFETNGYFYVYYTKPGDPLTNQVTRFTVSADNPDIADPASALVILDNIPADIEHNAGHIQFGPDGKLYVSTGDARESSDAQSLETLAGKILRINPDGSVPADNPFVGTPDARGEVWAYGLRNPFTGDIDPVTGAMYINDVGRNDWEEINLGAAEANYGWPECDGPCEDPEENPEFKDPVYAYSQSEGCAITGGVFYRGSQLPEEYHGNYFFADFCGQWIKRLLPDGSVADFATEAPKRVIDLEVSPDGSLYYLQFSTGSFRPTKADGAIYRTQLPNAANRVPTAVVSASPTSGTAPLEVNFDGSGSSDPDGDPLSYTWDFGDESDPTTGVTASHTYSVDGLFDVQLVVDDQKGGANSATITIQVGNPPVGSITSPAEGTTFSLGDTIQYTGTGMDQEDGTLPPSAFSWSVVLLHHPETDPLHHVHPFLGPIEGIESGSFQIPQEIHDHDIWFRIYLTVTDSDDLTHELTRDIFPIMSTLTLQTDPPGLEVILEDQSGTAPVSRESIVGSESPSPQVFNGEGYRFESWSDGGPAMHTITTPASDTTYTATYKIDPDFDPSSASYRELDE
jgi:glucose/arabinose dehydrogenase